MSRTSVAIGTLLLIHVLSANAQTLYVDDQLQIGLHAKPTLSSPIIELLPSGTELQLIERNGALAKVRTSSDVEGWVDGNYISTALPARAQVKDMEAELAGAQAALAEVQAKLVVMEQRPEHVGTAQASVQSANLTSGALREIQLLAEENQRLKQQNAELEAVLRMTEERKSSPPAANNAVASTLPAQHAFGSAHTVIDVTMLKRWHLILLASVLLLTFALGGWLVDWGVRRRHGGFRV